MKETDIIQSNVAASSTINNNFQINFLDVATSSTANEKKGDSVLIDMNGEYVLIDGGDDTNESYVRLKKYLMEYCNKVNNMVVISTIIVTHNHWDHYGGIKNLIEDKDFKVNRVYINAICEDKSSLESLCGMKKISHALIHPGSPIIVLEPVNNNSKITIYPPAQSFGESTHQINDASIIVKVEGPSSKYLILGDTRYIGLNKARLKYGVGLFSKNYEVCQFGHHGLYSKIYPSPDDLVNFYNTHIKAKEYYLTTAETTKNKEDFVTLFDSFFGSATKTARITGTHKMAYEGSYCIYDNGTMLQKVQSTGLISRLY